jgi:predicted ATPase
MLGYPDQALRRSREAIALARQLSHPTNLAHARLHIGMFHQFRREGSETLELAEALGELSAEHGLPFYVMAASVLRGWALAELGNGEEGLAQVRQGLAASAKSAPWYHAYSLALLAEVYGQARKAEEGLVALMEALRAVEATAISFYEPEMHRLKGELLVARAPEIPTDAEDCFRRAIAFARGQGAKSLELRAVLSLSRLLLRHGKEDEARPMLEQIYGWFTEGFDTADLKEARALLQVIP